MADEKKPSFPKIPAKNWWALREKFKQTIPATVSENYVSSVLTMTPESARANVITPLKAVGLIAADGKPTDLAKQWRDDHQYSLVCETIRKAVYPQELLDAFPSPSGDTTGIERWFMNHSGVGAPAGKMLAAFYSLLSEADPAKAKEQTNASSKSSGSQSAKPKTAHAKPHKAKEKAGASSGNGGQNANHFSNAPSLHIDVQVHIAADASAEQIDKIFASMAKHLKGFQHTQELTE